MEVESSCDAVPSATIQQAEMSPSSSAANGTLQLLLSRASPFAESEFEPTPELQDLIRGLKILVVGAGGLGCELLKEMEQDLALLGFGNIDVIDMDTIDISNLNRQFLFRAEDVGQPKATIAAKRIMERVAGEVTVRPHYNRIEDMPIEFYSEFGIIVLGLDSLEARSYINQVACSFLEYDADGQPDLRTVKPMVDGGTEGFKGHCRVIIPGVTPCFQCTIWLFPPQTKFPLCTLAETPRNAAHCIEHAHLIQWPADRSDEDFDPDNPEHMTWVYERALSRSKMFKISGVTLSYTQGVVKNIIPAIASTNAIIAGITAQEVLKLATQFSKGLNNFMMYVGSESVYSHCVEYKRDAECIICSPGLGLEVDPRHTLQEVMDQIVADHRLDGKVSAPSVTFEGNLLYMRAPPSLEEMTRPNLERKIGELMNHNGGESGSSNGGTLIVNDKKLQNSLRFRVAFKTV